MVAFLCRCKNSMGIFDGENVKGFVRVHLVDDCGKRGGFPDPVGPVTRTMPFLR